ncbi:pectin lyase-like protein [Fistulina hepatica ATCC 64428]|uniref:galacturonan 1,4-alpha-galacturonidase n=1 Tax=Fistulina hepatica ATCC 64428 TaxID=1128425 RepID=A0A0D7AFU4_9AGAR|nr:pectin lyase-like protein [Fistulina hepatica ATCC 64428]
MLKSFRAAITTLVVFATTCVAAQCVIKPLGYGRDDTNQVEAAIAKCGHYGTTVFQPGSYNITRKMTWDLVHSHVDLHGLLNFVPDIEYWLNADNTYRVVFIQDQASWFVLTGHDYIVDAHNTGGIQGNGQPWWEYYENHTREDGDGRPISLTIYKSSNAAVNNFLIESPPFWCNAIAESHDVVYDGMNCNATNSNPAYYGQNAGIDFYRSNRVTAVNWQASTENAITNGDDCIAVKGNSTNVFVNNLTCYGGNGIAFGSLGQYWNLSDYVENVLIEDVKILRINESIQPNMEYGVYFKSWTGEIVGVPPTGGGGGTGLVTNVTVRNVYLDQADDALALYQTNSGNSSETPSTLMFADLRFVNWTGAISSDELVSLACSPAVGCWNITFEDWDVTVPSGENATSSCSNAYDVEGLDGKCAVH